MKVKDFDLAIIGAGIIGATTAYLAHVSRPEWYIALLDRSFVGGGATHYSAALDLPFGRTIRQRNMVSRSVSFYRDLKARYPELPIQDISFALVAPAADVAEAAAGFIDAALHPAGVHEWQQVRLKYPDLTIPQGHAVMMGGNARYSASTQLAIALIDKAREDRNVECWEGTEVKHIEDNPCGHTLILGDGRRITAKRAVIATGPWLTSGPGGAFSQAAGIRTKKVAAMHIDWCPPPDAPVVYFPAEDAFLLPLYEQKKLLLSFTAQEWDCSAEISRLRIKADDRTLALSILNRYCPALTKHCSGGRVFCDAYSLDRAPFVARISNLHSPVVAGGSSGSGVRLAPAIALEALELFDISASPEKTLYEKSIGTGASTHS
ncbi:MAG TPA: FAD-binding oxidoreductase [Candidatus Angelobacter sp.]|jgi:glycine/D-amino acid oxidase-like deaminating enzyme